MGISCKLKRETKNRLCQIEVVRKACKYNLQSAVRRKEEENEIKSHKEAIRLWLREKQDNLMEERTRGVIIRNQFQWYEEGDKLSKF